MKHRRQKGFTIVEVVLFLAMSGLFLTVAFIGIRGKTANVQFTDSMRSLENLLVGERDKLLNGVNPALSSPGTCGGGVTDTGESGDCVLIGRVVSFGLNSADMAEVQVNALYGKALDLGSALYADKSIYQLIDAADPRPDGQVETNLINWGTEFEKSKSININSAGTQDAGNFSQIGWLRSPNSSDVVPIVFHSDVSDLGQTYLYDPTPPLPIHSRMGDDVNTRLCFIGTNDRVAAIYFRGGGNKTATIELVFDDAGCKP